VRVAQPAGDGVAVSNSTETASNDAFVNASRITPDVNASTGTDAGCDT
jgi:hypothetical protein